MSKRLPEETVAHSTGKLAENMGRPQTNCNKNDFYMIL
jgi:hypothetical protein